ncbi:MAG: hypothetical protein KA450_04625 [Bacteroidia bacterium]|nr:hypothetical protein [Bacteroidia bacterium]
MLFTFSACSHNSKEIDISEIKIDFKFSRFENDLQRLNTANATETKQKLAVSYGQFFDRFNENIIQIGSSNQPGYELAISSFLNDAAISTVYSDVQTEFASTEKLESDFESALKHYHYYFPNKIVPHIATFISGFNYPIAVTDSVLGVGLDMYLGKNYKYYKLMAIPNYQVDFMSKHYIVVDAVRSWLQTEYEGMDVHKNLLSEMVFQGKLVYALDHLLPQEEDSVKLEFTAQQLQWVNNSEQSIWAYFIDKNLLYSTKASENVKYINSAPFTIGMPKASPGRVGVWLGYKIVSAYMERHKEITLAALMEEKNAQKILNDSHYKPRK